jgi:anion-transporting  ArsA/GET3 family ATPase
MTPPSKRLYIVTGKGGVGKSVFALSLCKSLKDRGQKVLYNSFDQQLDPKICQTLGIDHFELSVQASAETYMGKKLGSRMVASWIMKTPFFSSLFYMIPGLGHMILLGNIINALEEDPELCIVVDSPSSGHALTMLESSHNFKSMFRKGLIVKDIERMHKFIYAPNGLKAFILTLPTLMAIQEGVELKQALENLDLKDIEIIMNDSYEENTLLKEEPVENLPEFLKKKLALEREVKEKFDTEITRCLPHYPTIDTLNTVEQMIEGGIHG